MQIITVEIPTKAIPKKTPSVVSPPVPPKKPYKKDNTTPTILIIAM